MPTEDSLDVVEARDIIDIEALRDAIYAVSIRHDWANTTDTEDRTEEIATEYAARVVNMVLVRRDTGGVLHDGTTNHSGKIGPATLDAARSASPDPDAELTADVAKFVRWSANVRDDTAEAIAVARALDERISERLIGEWWDSAAARQPAPALLALADKFEAAAAAWFREADESQREGVVSSFRGHSNVPSDTLAAARAQAFQSAARDVRAALSDSRSPQEPTDV